VFWVEGHASSAAAQGIRAMKPITMIQMMFDTTVSLG